MKADLMDKGPASALTESKQDLSIDAALLLVSDRLFVWLSGVLTVLYAACSARCSIANGLLLVISIPGRMNMEVASIDTCHM